MTAQILKCPHCKSNNVKEIFKGKYKCSHCDTEFVYGLDIKDSEYIIKHTEKALWEQTVEQIEKILFNLNEEVHKEYIDDKEVVHWSRELRKLIPDHFMASFYEIAVSNDKRALSEFIGDIDVNSQYGNIDEVLRLSIKLISIETMLAINDLIIRAYEKRDIEKYSEWNDKLQIEQKKIDESVYDVTKPRDVFIAYKSEDMKEVEKLVDILENEEGLECFVAARNLQHGRITDYDKKLEQAMDSCRAIVFVSSKMSRKTGDARTKELPYIQKKDFEAAPSEYRVRNEYKKISKRYKKPRVEYVIEPYVGAGAEGYTKTFFDGYERILKPNIKDVSKSIFEQFDSPIDSEDTKETVTEKTKRDEVKYCLACGTENPITVKYCGDCGNSGFVDTYEKYVKEKTRRELETEYAAKLEAERKEREKAERALQEAARRAREQAERERKAQEEAARKEEQERRAKEEAARRAREQAERERKAQEEAARKAEQARKAKQDAEKKEQENTEKRRAREAAAKITQQFRDFEMNMKKEKKRDANECAYKGWEYYKNGNYTEAVKWYRKAAEQGDASAQYNLGGCYYTGQGVKQDYYESVKWFGKAAEQGHAGAQYNLGGCYNNGQGVKQDYYEAVKWLGKAAEQGHAKAQFNLGWCYETGRGVVQDYTEAVKWYRKAAEQGDASAQNNLGACYYNGRGVRLSYTEAVEWFGKAAEHGNMYAQHHLGECYYYGRGVEKNDTEAVKWYRKAAERGHAKAQYYLGSCYEEGRGVVKNFEEALKWYRKSAEQGEAIAQNILGDCFCSGNGVKQNYIEAAKWYRKAAEQGRARAQYHIGLCYYNGQGVEQSYTEAVKWWKKAAEQGEAGAKLALKRLGE